MRRDEDYGRREGQGALTRYEPFGGLLPHSSFADFWASPWQMMRRMQEEMDRFFSGFGLGPWGTQASAQAVQTWSPSVDISQSDKEWTIEADLPGVKKDDIDLEVEDDRLVLRARMQESRSQGRDGQDQPEQGQRHYQMRERRYGYFERTFPLPDAVDRDHISCEFQDGVLTVHLPKSPERVQQVRRIPIGEGQAAARGSEQSRGERSSSAAKSARSRGGAHEEEEEETAAAGAKSR